MKLKELKKRCRSGQNLKARVGLVLVAVGLIIFCWASPSNAAPGDLDEEFGEGGKLEVPLYARTGAKVAIQSDGKIVVAGTWGTGDSRFALARYNSNGTIDPSFGENGIVITPPIGLGSDFVSGLAIQADGKIVVAGIILINLTPENEDFAVLRYNPNGSLDTSFGNNGKVITSLGQIYDRASSIVIQPDGKIVVAGQSYNSGLTAGVIAVVRYNGDGSLDPTFDGDGILLSDITPSVEHVRSAKIQTDGKILVAGESNKEDGYKPTIVRYNPDGSLDTAFGVLGVVRTNVPNYPDNYCGYSAIFVQRDRKIVAAGTCRYINFTGDAVAARYKDDGSLDTSFNDDGIVTTSISGGYDRMNAVTVQPNGKILVAGSSRINNDYDFSTIRYNQNGSLDSYFGAGGIVITRFRVGRAEEAASIAIQQNGKIIVAGASIGFALVRYQGDRLSSASPLFDFDGDGKTDISIYRSLGREWWYQRSSDNQVRAVQFGGNPIQIAPADFDGDGKTDVAVWLPSDGIWWILRSSDNLVVSAQFGQNFDFAQPGDFDGDGRADISVFRPSNGTWFRLNSSDNQFVAIHFGLNDDRPLIADFDGDGKSDVAVWRPSDQFWYWLNSSNGQFNAVRFGLEADIPVTGDFDGDGRSDIGVFRRSDGIWHRLNSANNQYTAVQFGLNGDIPVVGDYDGDGKSDIAVWRSSDSVWYRIESGSGEFKAQAFGRFSDKPVPSAFLRSCLTGFCGSLH